MIQAQVRILTSQFCLLIMINELLFVVERNVGEFLATCPVDGIGESGMISIELGAIGQNLVGESIQVLDTAGEPRDSLLCHQY